MSWLRLFLVGLAGAFLVIPGNAADFQLASDGYYYSAGIPHTRSWVNGYYYIQNGCRYWQPGYWDYAKVEVTIKPAANPNDWRTEIAKATKERLEHQNFLESLKFAGLDAPATAYRGLSLHGYGSVQLGQYGVNGNTLYGYSLQSLSDVYGSSDFLGVGLQQYNRSLDKLGDLHGQSLAGLGQLLSSEGANRAKVADIIAVGQLLQTLRQSDKPAASKSEFHFRVGPDGKAEVIPAPDTSVKPDVYKAWQAQAQDQCASCHFGARESLKGGFDIASWPGLPVAKKMELASKHLLTKNPADLMPRDKDNKPGKPLKESDVLDLWLKVSNNK